MVGTPRVVIAAPGSGHGKTTLATGLLAALARRGDRVAGFKVGPDYIDPSYHALASGRPSRNLDPVLVGEELVAPLFAAGAAGADIAVVEGVMGLYDGRAHAGDHGSTAQVAALLSAPVILVVDASAQGRSVAALVHGFAVFGKQRLGGVVLNRVGSDRHEAILRDALDEVGVPVLGVLRRQPDVAVPSRHLGLVPAAERTPEARSFGDGAGVAAGASEPISGVPHRGWPGTRSGGLFRSGGCVMRATVVPARQWVGAVALGCRHAEMGVRHRAAAGARDEADPGHLGRRRLGAGRRDPRPELRATGRIPEASEGGGVRRPGVSIAASEERSERGAEPWVQ